MNEDKLAEQLRQMEANVQITHVLLHELIAVLPQGEQVLQRFQQTIENMTHAPPKHVHPEYLVELRARSAQTVAIVRQTMRDANASR